jgi:hypothetical protein
MSNGMLQCLNINESMTTCYTSIEKLAIIKPQSKDYILCFDTSSIDQNSTNTSCDLNNLANLLSASEILEMKSHTDNSVLSSTCTSTGSNEDNGRKKTIKVILTKSDNDDSCEEKKVILLNSLDYPDSGIESARTLSPQIHTSNSNGVDLSLADVITGPIGSLPAEATAVNFGRMARSTATPSRADLAAGIITLVGQTIALIAINAARALPASQIVITGHLTDMATIRRMLAAVGGFYGQTFQMPADAGYATALGALLTVQDQTR